MSRDNLNLMEGDIVNEESSIYNTTKPAPETPKPAKPAKEYKFDISTLKKFIPKYQLLIFLFISIILISLSFLVLAGRNKQQEQPIENIVLSSPIPSVTSDPKILELARKVEKFKKDTEESAVTKKLTPPIIDLDVEF